MLAWTARARSNAHPDRVRGRGGRGSVTPLIKTFEHVWTASVHTMASTMAPTSSYEFKRARRLAAMLAAAEAAAAGAGMSLPPPPPSGVMAEVQAAAADSGVPLPPPPPPPLSAAPPIDWAALTAQLAMPFGIPVNGMPVHGMPWMGAPPPPPRPPPASALARARARVPTEADADDEAFEGHGGGERKRKWKGGTKRGADEPCCRGTLNCRGGDGRRHEKFCVPTSVRDGRTERAIREGRKKRALQEGSPGGS